MTSYSTKISGDRFNRRLEILLDGKRWGEAFPGQDHFYLSVVEAEAVLGNILLLEYFGGGPGDGPAGEVTWIPDASMASDADPDGQAICNSYVQLHHGGSRRKYNLQMVRALLNSYEDICRFQRVAEIMEQESAEEALQLVIDDLRTVIRFLPEYPTLSASRIFGLGQSSPDMDTCPKTQE